MADIVAIGALNVDCIARSGTDSILPTGFELEQERQVSSDRIDGLLREFGGNNYSATFGGSAFNVVRALHYAAPEFSVGFVGVAGTASKFSLDLSGEIDRLGLPRALLRNSEAEVGVCFSIVRGDKRGLETYPGANVEMASHLEDQRESILAELFTAKIVHITSLFDECSPKVLLSILTEARRRNPSLRISFDPGHFWTSQKRHLVYELAGTADFLFLNNAEFFHLADSLEVREESVRRLLMRVRTRGIVIVLKEFNQILTFSEIGGKLISRRYPNDALASSKIRNPTGAGDAFAAGYLMSVLIPSLCPAQSALLGLRLVRRKLISEEVDISSLRYGQVFSDFLDDLRAGQIDNPEFDNLATWADFGLSWKTSLARLGGLFVSTAEYAWAKIKVFLKWAFMAARIWNWVGLK